MFSFQDRLIYYQKIIMETLKVSVLGLIPFSIMVVIITD